MGVCVDSIYSPSFSPIPQHYEEDQESQQKGQGGGCVEV